MVLFFFSFTFLALLYSFLSLFSNMQMIPGDPFSLSTSLGAFSTQEQNTNPNPKPNAPSVPKKKRNLPGTPGIYIYSLIITEILFLLYFFFYLAWILSTLHSTARYNNCRGSKHMFNKITVSP